MEPAGGGGESGHRGFSACLSLWRISLHVPGNVSLAAQSLGQPATDAISLVIFHFSDLLRGSHSYSPRSLCLLSLWCHKISNPQMTLAGASPRQTSERCGGERGGRHCKNAGNSCQFLFLLNVTSGFSSFFLVLELQGKMHDYVG